jgi:hypothetical protein
MTTRALDPHIGFDGLVCDLDGVLFHSSLPIPGPSNGCEREGCGSTSVLTMPGLSIARGAAKLREMGIDVSRDNLLTSATDTASQNWYSERLHEPIAGADILNQPQLIEPARRAVVSFDMPRLQGSSSRRRTAAISLAVSREYRSRSDRAARPLTCCASVRKTAHTSPHAPHRRTMMLFAASTWFRHRRRLLLLFA